MEILSTCSSCGAQKQISVTQSVNAQTQSELKEKVRSGELFSYSCPHCGKLNLLKFPFLYHDPSQKLIILLSDTPMSLDGLTPDYSARLVKSVGDLIEKIKIFDAGLDDVVIEMCKLVTMQEMEKELALRFLSMDGADSELRFTYPLNGEMQVIAVGFNVYEDCAGIIRRNPSISEAISGLVTIDQEWLSGFFA